MRRTVILLAAVALVAACVTVNKSVLSRSRVAYPVPRDDVHVYLAGDTVPEHERIAILTAKGDENTTNTAQMIDRMRAEAGKLGANAIILGDIRDPGTGARVVGAIFGTPTNRQGQAIAVYVPSRDRQR